jgi:Arc/MetJ-type ribon-helix-helix transcriptional regulator
MERLQFYLDTEMNRKLETIAERLHVSKAEVIRRGIQMILQETQAVEEDALLDIVGIGAGGAGRVSVEHDRTLADSKLRRRRS